MLFVAGLALGALFGALAMGCVCAGRQADQDEIDSVAYFEGFDDGVHGRAPKS